MLEEQNIEEHEEGCSYLHFGKRTLKQEISFALWTLLWAISVVFCGFFLRSEVLPSLLYWPLLLTPVLLGLFAIKSYYHFVITADELVRRIQFESMSITFGVTIFVGLCSTTFVAGGMEELSAENIIVLMAVVWSAAQVYLKWKYR